MTIKYGVINTVIGLTVIWGIWLLGANIFSSDTMWVIVGVMGAGYALFVLNCIGRAILRFTFNFMPAPPVPKMTRFRRRKSLFDAHETIREYRKVD